ncbi:MAG TPA: hypothetical protein VFU97_08850 [Xanthobacteraceae bacterium]|nr:hypothetical protein [Xanthobacteraceae bacterium]
MCLACEMESEWLAYLAAMARDDRPSAQEPGTAPADPARPAVKRPSAPPFVCEEPLPE